MRSGESLQKVADGVGVSKAYIWELERGDSSNPSLDLLKKLADHFNVTVAYFADDAIPPEDARSLEFFREYEGLTEEQWQVLRNIASHLKKNG